MTSPTSSTPVETGDIDPGRMRFNLQELAGGLGDLGTFLPLMTGLAITAEMDLGAIFLFAGVMAIASGYLFRQPVPVQPMKLIAAVAIAGGLTRAQIGAAGIFMGLAMLTVALTGVVGWLERVIPKPVVRGIQAGVGIKLAWTGLAWVYELPVSGWDSWITCTCVVVALACLIKLRQPALVYVFAAGFVVLALASPEVYRDVQLGMPSLELIRPSGGDWWQGLLHGALPQFPLTLLNSVIAVCALSADYFPGRGIRPRRMAASVGVMNLVLVPLGACPMCHGSGGLAAQYRFGARTGGSVVMLGVFQIAAGLLLGKFLLDALQHYPRAILGVMIIAAGVTLASAARDALRGRSLVIVLCTVGGMIAFNTVVGFAIGCIVAFVYQLALKLRTRAGSLDTDSH
jgi:MFS superfamily sulfate permease-like transporter